MLLIIKGDQNEGTNVCASTLLRMLQPSIHTRGSIAKWSKHKPTN